MAHRPHEDEIATAALVPDTADRQPVLRSIVVIEGPDTGKIYTLDASSANRILLGTSPVCEVRLTDPTVSRRHAAFEPLGQRFRFTDLASTNGTWVDGVAIVEAFVRGGEIVRVGSTAMRLEAAIPTSRAMLPSAMRFGRLIGASVAMRRLYPLCERLAKTRVPIVIEGETGTGKEVLAESLHEESGATGPFVVFDCTAVSPSLIESELFGHERGAFTGAVATRAGVFEEADGGTLLIDEIGDLPLPLQSKLLRALDRGELKRVGSQRTVKVDVRVLAATRRNLDEEVAAGRFRDDLFHRLAVARVELPPLRTRQGDVTLLATHFANELKAQLPPEVLARFEAYTWPGNVRELRNAVSRFVALGDEAQPMSSDSSMPPPSGGDGTDTIDAIVASQLPYPLARRKALKAFERRYVESVLAAHDGNVAKAARASGLALRYFRLVKGRVRRT